MTTQNILPSEGYLRLVQIIGQPEVTPEQAILHQKQPTKTRTGKPKFQHKRPRTGITPVIPISKTQWYDGIKKGIYPAPVHLGRTAVWRVSDIRALLDRIAA
jgi:hypothetical protein